MAHILIPPEVGRGGRGRRNSEFKASLVYKVSARTARVTQRNPVSKNKKNSQAVVVHAFNPITWEVEAGGFLSLRLAWSTE